MCFPSFHHSLQPASASLIPQTQHLAPIAIAIASYMGSFILVQVSMEILQNNSFGYHSIQTHNYTKDSDEDYHGRIRITVVRFDPKKTSTSTFPLTQYLVSERIVILTISHKSQIQKAQANLVAV
ncbi:predicted protein [Botrytis cinerea T4]|uniref:Uncharacterized protein n=1 Tax=Botryotinia fuckeliana (strain T4) TaxID=999810 RepID=G2YIS6_BOTF4|nr:predicted protein [Botrytis cinerea T4]